MSKRKEQEKTIEEASEFLGQINKFIETQIKK